jgi:hypothetical protein
MDVNLLIDAIVRQTTVLIAQLATLSGARATLAGTANQVFLSLVQELKQQGLSNKVIADMFGLALRTYHNRLQRLSESQSFAGRSLWEAVLDCVRERGPVTRAQVLQQFYRDDELQVRAVLTDLVGSQLLVRTGRGDTTTFRLATKEDRVEESESAELERLTYLLWVAIHRFGPVDVKRLAEIVPAPEELLLRAIAPLEAAGRVTRSDTGEYVAESYLVPVGIRAVFEASVFDHYQAMVTALCMKLRKNQFQALPDDWVGGSTYCYDVWEGHPDQADVAGFLSMVRRQAVALRERVENHNRTHERPAQVPEQRFFAYVGQGVIAEETAEPKEDE